MEQTIQHSLSGMKYTTTSGRALRKPRGFKRSLDEDSDPSEHSSDSGLELDHQTEVQLATRGIIKQSSVSYTFEEDSNTEFCFPDMPGRGRSSSAASSTPLSAQLSSVSRDGRISLTIISQPEQQHRARYQTEGSRGAVKDRTGNGFPIVKLSGYNQSTTLQIFVGTDVGRVAPHMFYQACRVSGKNSTPCVERKVEGTVLIEVDLDPSKDMLVTCDCVGILKERNVDVEHRFPEQSAARNKKKSTRCRMVFRAAILNMDGSSEILQVCSQPIVCTQPPGIPEICKKSLSSCPAAGGLELFILGKNFLKDTKVVFQSSEAPPSWEEAVVPDKEFLQQNHLVCVVPPYHHTDITESITVKMFILSSGKASDPHPFMFTPTIQGPIHPTPMEAQPCTSYFSNHSPTAYLNGNRVIAKACNMAGHRSDADHSKETEAITRTLLWPSTKPEACDDEDTMMPPPSSLLPLRRPSLHQAHGLDRDDFKSEITEDMSQHSMSLDGEISPSPPEAQGVDLTMKPTIFPHLSFTTPNPLVNSYLKPEPGQQFPILYENEPQFIEDVMMRPPPSKIHVRDFTTEGNFTSLESGKEQQNFEFNQRVRSGSFSHSSSINDNSMNGFEAPRVRSASMSHSFAAKAQFFSQASLTSFVPKSVCSLKDVNNAISSAVKHASQNFQEWVQTKVNYENGLVFLQPPFLCNPGPNQIVLSEPQVMSAATSGIGTINESYPASHGMTLCEAASRANVLDAFVNSAADSHMNAETSSIYVPTTSAYSPSITQQFPTAVSVSEPAPLPVTVTEISRSVEEVPCIPSTAPPINGMVSQEMVKMTEHDLIRYINPSCFDQV